jgi:hypothetical protein
MKYTETHVSRQYRYRNIQKNERWFRHFTELIFTAFRSVTSKSHRRRPGIRIQPILHSHQYGTGTLKSLSLKPVLRIRIRRIHMFLGLMDPDPKPIVKDTDPDPSISKQKL